MSTIPTPLTVYFDKSCPICREEIYALKSIDQQSRLALVDCSDDLFSDRYALDADISQDTLKNKMHVRDAEGKWYLAADAFVAMYETVGLEAAANLLKKRGVRSLFDWMYPLFVKHRHKLRYLGVTKIVPWMIRRAAAKQTANAQKCAIERKSTDN